MTKYQRNGLNISKAIFFSDRDKNLIYVSNDNE